VSDLYTLQIDERRFIFCKGKLWRSIIS